MFEFTSDEIDENVLLIFRQGSLAASCQISKFGGVGSDRGLTLEMSALKSYSGSICGHLPKGIVSQSLGLRN